MVQLLASHHTNMISDHHLAAGADSSETLADHCLGRVHHALPGDSAVGLLRMVVLSWLGELHYNTNLLPDNLLSEELEGPKYVWNIIPVLH